MDIKEPRTNSADSAPAQVGGVLALLLAPAIDRFLSVFRFGQLRWQKTAHVPMAAHSRTIEISANRTKAAEPYPQGNRGRVGGGRHGMLC